MGDAAALDMDARKFDEAFADIGMPGARGKVRVSSVPHQENAE